MPTTITSHYHTGAALSDSGFSSVEIDALVHQNGIRTNPRSPAAVVKLLRALALEGHVRGQHLLADAKIANDRTDAFEKAAIERGLLAASDAA